MAGAEEPPPSGLAWAGNAPWFAPPPTSEGRQGVRSRGAHCHRFVRPGPASTLHSDRRRRDKGCRISAAAETNIKGRRKSEGRVGLTRTGEPPNRRRGTKSRSGEGTARGTHPRMRARLHSKSCTRCAPMTDAKNSWELAPNHTGSNNARDTAQHSEPNRKCRAWDPTPGPSSVTCPT